MLLQLILLDTSDQLALVFDFTLKCFYLSGNLVYFSRSALPPDHPRHVYIGDNQVFRSDWTNLLLANKGKQILINQEAVAKQTKAIKGYTPLPLQHQRNISVWILLQFHHLLHLSHHSIISGYPLFRYPSIYQLVDVPLWPTDYLDPVMDINSWN